MPFTAFIPSGSAAQFANAQQCEGKTVSVSGKIQLYKEKPEIIVNSPTQISATGLFLGRLSKRNGQPLGFDGLWGLFFIDKRLYFTAGIADEAHGLFGVIKANP